MTWADLMNECSDAVDAHLGGEALTFQPMKKLTVNDPPTEDDSRSERSVVGIWSSPAQDIDMLEDRPTRTKTYGGDGHEKISSNSPRVSVDDRQFLADEMPKLGDRFKRTATGDLYRINDVQTDNQGRTVYVLSFLNREA